MKPCPFCGSDKLSENIVPNTQGNRRFIICSNCMAHGPWSYKPLTATDQWEKRSNEADQRDAARYRWLRKNSTKPVEPWSTHEGPESLDAIVDAAMFDARVAAMSAQSDKGEQGGE